MGRYGMKYRYDIKYMILSISVIMIFIAIQSHSLSLNVTTLNLINSLTSLNILPPLHRYTVTPLQGCGGGVTGNWEFTIHNWDGKVGVTGVTGVTEVTGVSFQNSSPVLGEVAEGQRGLLGKGGLIREDWYRCAHPSVSLAAGALTNPALSKKLINQLLLCFTPLLCQIDLPQSGIKHKKMSKLDIFCFI